VRGDGEDEGAERPAHVLVRRQRGQQGEADLLRQVVLVLAAGLGQVRPGQPGPAVADDGGPELAQQRLDGVRPGQRILLLPGFQAARVQQVVVVGRGSCFPAGNREVLASRHGELMPG
jgi:hypothetical protein